VCNVFVGDLEGKGVCLSLV